MAVKEDKTPGVCPDLDECQRRLMRF